MKTQFFKGLLAFIFTFVLIGTDATQAYYNNGHYYRNGHTYGHGYRHCRWVSGHRRNGHWVPRHRVCWR
jgi:hypothetical protein